MGVAENPGAGSLAEGRGKWMLPVGDGLVTQLWVDQAFTLVLESWIEIRIETAFSCGMAGALVRFEPSDPVALAPLLRLLGVRVTSAEIRKDGRLMLAFLSSPAAAQMITKINRLSPCS